MCDDCKKIKKDNENLVKALKHYHCKWESERYNLNLNEESKNQHVKLTSLLYLSQWLINSIRSPNGAADIRNILKE